ncbi:MAG: ribosome biogenesis GTP-binding protein YihA/YsxC [Pseudomonadota bacterium]
MTATEKAPPGAENPALKPSLEKEALEAGRRLFAGPCAFVAGATSLAVLPPAELPEVAFCGRSNVGKSSLLNALTGRKALARISTTPGRTQQINLFRLDEKLMLADLPGHGFARASKQAVRQWTALVECYLKTRPSLKRVLLLVDARHGLKEVDRRLLALLDKAAVSVQIVLTKGDKPTTAALAAALRATAEESLTHGPVHPEILVTSARTGEGIPELRAGLARLARGGEFH